MNMKRRLFQRIRALLRAMLMTVAVAAVLTGCAAHREMEHHTTHTAEADTMAAEASRDESVSRHDERIDSVVTASMWQVMQEFVASQKERETTTETVHEWEDSLGNRHRQEQRTTQRETDRREQQRTEQTEQRMRAELNRTVERIDSVWGERLAQMESRLREATATDTRTVTKPEPLSWWARAWTWLRGILIGIVIGIVIILWRNVYADFKHIARRGLGAFYKHLH